MAHGFQYYVDIITVLAQKDLKVRYRNSVLGFVWSLLNPLAYMVILTAVFSVLLKVAVPNFAAWLLLGLLVWRFFSIATNQSLTSIIANPSLVTKVYLPRYLIVLANNLANLVGATLEFIALLPLLLFLGVTFSLYAILLPVVLGIEFVLIFGISLAISALNLKYRDFSQLWDIALQLGFFVSPIVYDSSFIPARYSFIYSLNPITRLIQLVRDIFLQKTLPSSYDLGILLTIVILFLVLGLTVFHKLEQRFAEEL